MLYSCGKKPDILDRQKNVQWLGPPDNLNGGKYIIAFYAYETWGKYEGFDIMPDSLEDGSNFSITLTISRQEDNPVITSYFMYYRDDQGSHKVSLGSSDSIQIQKISTQAIGTTMFYTFTMHDVNGVFLHRIIGAVSPNGKAGGGKYGNRQEWQTGDTGIALSGLKYASGHARVDDFPNKISNMAAIFGG